MPPVASTDKKYLSKIIQDGPFIESTGTLRVLVEKLDLEEYLKERDYEGRKRQVLHEISNDSNYKVKASLSEVVNTIQKKKPRLIKEKKTELLPSRRSRRLINLPIDCTEDGLYEKAVVEDEQKFKVGQEMKRKRQVLHENSDDTEHEIKAGLSEVVNAIQKKKPKPIKKEMTKLLSPRKSTRLKNLPIDYNVQGMFQRAVVEAKQERKGKYYEPLPCKMSFEDALKSEEMYENFCKDIRIQPPESEEKTILYDDTFLQKLPLKLSNVSEKVTPERITSLSWYPSVHNMIIAAGDKLGNVGILNVNSDSNSHLFKVHNKGTTHVQFNPFNPVELVSSSYEGTLRCGDMIQNMFTKVFSVSKKTSCSYFDFLTSTTYLVGLSNGKVVLVDRKARHGNAIDHFCHKEAVKSVNIHPMNKNVFATAGIRGSVCLWDLRMLQKQPIVDIIHHKKCVYSAFFSPTTGNSLLTKSSDNSMCLFNSRNLTQDIKPIQTFGDKKCKYSCITASWLPNSDDLFCNHVSSPYRIQLRNKDRSVFPLTNENRINTCNTFHPFVPFLAGSDFSSGKIFVFT